MWLRTCIFIFLRNLLKLRETVDPENNYCQTRESVGYVPLSEASTETYKKLGFKSGLEIHQQLATRKKLFCRCPAGRYSDEYDTEILRHMRPTLSELGEYDGTALMELKTRKDIIYRLNSETVCTYEMDDSPPFQVNESAVDIALEIAMLLRLQLVDELHIARKQYLDGSECQGHPSGFRFGNSQISNPGVNIHLSPAQPSALRWSHPCMKQ